MLTEIQATSVHWR